MRPLAPRNSLSALPRIGLVVLAVLVPRAGIAAPLPTAAARSANYGRVCEPQIKPAFLPLPPGSVQPSGWLRDWAIAAREGLTGHLDEYEPTFRDAWKGFHVDTPGAAADGTGWPLEQCAYWLDGALRLGFVLHDEALIRKSRARLDPIVDGVNKADFGTSFIYWRKGYKPEGFNSWAHSQLGLRWWRCTWAAATGGCSTPWSRCMPIIR